MANHLLPACFASQHELRFKSARTILKGGVCNYVKCLGLFNRFDIHMCIWGFVCSKHK